MSGKWAAYDVTNLFSVASLHEVTECEEWEPVERLSATSSFPDFGAHLLEKAALANVGADLRKHIHLALSGVNNVPSVFMAKRMSLVWDRVVEACLSDLYSTGNVARILKAAQKEEEVVEASISARGSELSQATHASEEKLTGNSFLMEVGIKTGLSLVFSLLKQSWAQHAWQRQLEQVLSQSASLAISPAPAINLPNEVLKSVLDVLVTIPPLSLNNSKTLSQFSETCLNQSTEFLQWILSPTSLVDAGGKRLALQIMLSLYLQRGSLVHLLEWVEGILLMLGSYQDVGVTLTPPSFEVGYCQGVISEIQMRTELSHKASVTGGKELPQFSPEMLTDDGHVGVMGFLHLLMRELSSISERCTSYFSGSEPGRSDFFMSQSSDVYAFGSNSSSQMAMRSSDKFHAATFMPHMEDAQVVSAGHYCTFLVYGDGSVKACGKGSYGRLGLGYNEMQSTLQQVETFPRGVEVRVIASSKGSDGHSLALTSDGHVYSWGDGSGGKLGHGDTLVQKVPKLIAAFADKVVRCVACGNKHSAAVTEGGELYTWGEGDFGRLGHGNTVRCKVPTKVEAIGAVKQVACGEAHTLALGMDGNTVWSFGNGDLGRLGHGDTTRCMLPKVIEAFQGMNCQKVCAANQFSLVLVGGKVYSFGKGSGIGQGNTEARQMSPWLIETLETEMVIDITTGDGHCLALTKRGEVYAWGTNSMGQCGQGHSNGSILQPAKVLGLDGVQVQQISAGTSHSIVWTALPCNRSASALWYWPYCVSVGEKTLEKLLNMLNKFSDFHSEEPAPPFQSIESQQTFVLSLLTLLRTHLSVVASVGPDNIHTACGSLVKPLRHLLFKLVDSQLTPALDKETSLALDVGSSILLPPVQDRLDLLLSILPEDPSSIVNLTTGQYRQLDILLGGFSSRAEFVGLFASEVESVGSGVYEDIDLSHVNKLFELSHRMVQYLHTATLCSLRGQPLPQAIRLGCPLLNSFQEFITSAYINVLSVVGFILKGVEPAEGQCLPNKGKQLLIHHLAPFDHLLRDTSLAILEAIREAAAAADNPNLFLQTKLEVVFGFLAYEYPYYFALSMSAGLDVYFDTVEVLMEVAKTVHQLVSLLPPLIVAQLEQEELLWDKTDDEFDVLSMRGGECGHPWRQLVDYERHLCHCSAKLLHAAYNIASPLNLSVLEYSPSVPGKGKAKKPSLLNSHLLSNGAVGGEEAIARALYTWASLCKSLPGEASQDLDVQDAHRPTILSWSSCVTDYNLLLKRNKEVVSSVYEILEQEVSVIEEVDACTAPVLYCLAVGGAGNEKAENVYATMMDYAQQKDWDTCSDESSVPELKQVSCAALACLLKHTGLSSSVMTDPMLTPRKKMVDVYRHVFSLRHEVFTHRPIPDSEGVVSEEDRKLFRQQCNGICVTLMLLMCVLEPAIPEETDPLIPRRVKSPGVACSTKNAGSRSPGSFLTHQNRVGSGGGRHPFRMFSTSVAEEKGKVPPLVHSSSVVPAPKLEQDISLSGVKQALSLLRWQRDRLDHLEASSGSDTKGSFHLTICSTLISIVCQVFNQGEGNSTSAESTGLLNRVDLIKALLDHQHRAENRKKCLKKMLQFSENSDLFLPSSQVIFKATCLKHSTHYSDDIAVAPSVLQHEIKSLSHKLVKLIMEKLLTVDTAELLQLSDSKDPTLSQLALTRDFMLALQWINFNHHAGDLQFFFSEQLYGKIAELSCVPSTEVSLLPSLPSSKLWEGLKMACALMMQSLAMQISLNADILKTAPDFLMVVSKHLFGQLICFIATDNIEIMQRWKASESYSLEMREVLLGDFLRFLNTFSATHTSVRAVLASEQWFTTLLKLVDTDITTGESVVSSLKTRLLALQVLGTIMSEHTDKSAEARAKCTKIIEDLLELMYRCMFACPVASLQGVISELSPLPPTEGRDKSSSAQRQTTTIPFAVDPEHQVCVTCAAQDGGCLVATFDCSVPGHFIGQTPMTAGKYTWKVTVESAESIPSFVVGVSHKPLANTDIETSDEIWAISNKGSIFHAGEADHCMMITLAPGDSLELQYNANSADGTLLCDYGTGYMVVHGISKSGSPVYPCFFFPQDESLDPNLVSVRFHPIVHSCSSSFSDFRGREQLASGSPHLSPASTTLSQAVVSLIHQLQDKEPWNRSIGQVIGGRLAELDSLIHHLLSMEETLSSTSDMPSSEESVQPSLSLLMSRLTQTVWPAMAVVGGLDSGLCLGRTCRLEGEGAEGSIEAVVVSIPDSERKVVVEERVTAHTLQKVQRTVSLEDLSLTSQTKFSLPLIMEQLSPSILLNLAHLAGYLDQHSIPAILERAHYLHPSTTKDMLKCLQYQLICHSVLQMGAIKSLFTILYDESIIKLLAYQPPPLEKVVQGGFEDRSELASAVKDVLKCLSSRATKPSPLKPCLRLLELQRLHSTLTSEALTSIAEDLSNCPSFSDGSSATLVEYSSTYENVRPDASEGTVRTTSGGSVSGSISSSSVFSPPDGGLLSSPEAARATTPPIVLQLTDMGFLRAQVDIAVRRCEVPEDTSEQARLQLLIDWILAHPNAVEEDQEDEEHVAEQQEEERLREVEEQARQNAAANEFISRMDEMLGPSLVASESNERVEDSKSGSKHAPDLLEGPELKQEIPDISFSGVGDSPYFLKPLLSALGISRRKPIPQNYEFAAEDPMGEELYKASKDDVLKEEGGSTEQLYNMTTPSSTYKITASCDNLMSQAQKLKSVEEKMSALWRLTIGVQVLVARHITLMLVANLSIQTSKSVTSTLRNLDLLDVHSLVRLLRLVDAGRINDTPGECFAITLPSSLYPLPALQCLSTAIASLVTEEGASVGPSAGLQLVQSCSRDLLTAAVGGADLIQQVGRKWHNRRRLADCDKEGKSDVSVLANPNFKVSQRLVTILAKSAGKLLGSASHTGGVVQMMDALTACLYSSKLEPKHRFWALQQLVKIFAVTGASDVVKKEQAAPKILVVPANPEQLSGHKGQILGCVQCNREKKLFSIGEDNCLFRWNLQPGLTQPDITVFPLPPPSTASQSTLNALLLPILTQSSNETCVASAVNETLCVWKTRDGKSVTHSFSELITTLQFKPLQDSGSFPLILVGLVDGGLVLAAVLKASIHLTPELQITDMGRCIKGAVCCVSWSQDGTQFAVASTTGHIRLFTGANEEYMPATEIIKDVQARNLCWSPDGLYLTVVGEQGSLQLWSSTSGAGLVLVHSFEGQSTHSVQWHSQIAKDGQMLVASGAKDGKVHLWLVKGKMSQSEELSSHSSEYLTPGELVSHVTSLAGHVTAVTTLVFSEGASLLASSCKAGSVRIWDISTLSLLKLATRAGSEVIDLAWTEDGLAICYKNTFSLCVLPPGPEDYTGERSLRHCLPLLHHYSITEPSKTPCLTTFIKTLHYVLLEQYQYEQAELVASKQLVHSDYLQLLVALAVGIGLHTLLVSPPSPPHLPAPPTPNEWVWLTTFTSAMVIAESLSKRTTLTGVNLPAEMKSLSLTDKYQPTANDMWTVMMDGEILEWMKQRPEDWWASSGSTVYTWGNGTWSQLGHTAAESVPPAPANDWKDVQQIVAGSYCTYMVKCDGSVSSCGEGSFGRLGHGGSDNENGMRTISSLQGIPVVHVVAGPRVSTYTEEGFALALTHSGRVYSWGKCYKGRLGHSTIENIRSPKLVDALVPYNVKMIACCDYHCAVVTENGQVLTFGSKENGKLGHGRDVPPSSVGRVTEVARFYGADEQTLVPNVKIGYVSCGQMFTLAISEDGTKVFACGEADHCAFGCRDLTGDHYHPMLLSHLSDLGPFVKAVSGNKSAALLTADGRVYRFGKVYNGQGVSVPAECVQFPNQVKIVDLGTAASCTMAVAENGDIYYWGKYQYDGSSVTVQGSPTLLQSMSGKGMKQISVGVCHCAASNTTLPVKGVSNITVPTTVPAQFPSLREVSCEAAYARLMLLNHFSMLISKSWALFSIKKSDGSKFHVNPLSDEAVRSLLSPLTVEGMVASVVGKTMTRKSRGPSVTVQRIITTDGDDGSGSKVTSKPVFPQIASVILQKSPSEVRCPSRAWKVNLVGEGADDAGGVFDETMAQMCEELEGGLHNLLIPTPNSTNNCGFNTDRFVFNPRATVASDYKHLKFLGILLGVAMRTRKPLDLHLAQPMWKLLAGMSLTPVDLEEVDLMFIQTLYGIRDVHKSGIKEEDFSEMIPIESFEAQSMCGKFVPIVPGGTNIELTFQNRREYVEKALHFRLHELDEQVSVIREGMSCIMPVPLFCLYTAKMLEHAVCGKEQVDLAMLKKVVRYKNGTSEDHNVVKWLWQTLETFSNEERVLFLRFVSGRSRLPVRISDIPQRFRISVYGQGRDCLPTSQTCFFQLSLPNYPSQEVLCDRLRYAIRNCRSIDMDNYMLRRRGSNLFLDSEDEDDEDDDDDDDI